MIVILMEISYPKYSFFSRHLSFNNACLKGFIGLSHLLMGPTEVSYNGSLYVNVHYVVIEYENGKVKLAHYLILVVDLDNPNNQHKEWFSER